MKILTTGNPKIEKGAKWGYMSYGIHLAPYKLSGKNLCVSASKGCAAACLNTAGRGQMDPIQESRLKKTEWFNSKPAEFLAQLEREMTNAVKLAEKKGLIPCFRPNLTSDLFWESLGLVQKFPTVQFYDYTKHFRRIMDYENKVFPENYHLTFSRSESNDKQVESVINETEVNVAVVFADRPSHWRGRKVIDGDETDLRFLDPTNSIVGLTAKGKAKKDETGFVIQ